MVKSVNVSGVLSLADHVGKLTGSALGEAGVDALNETIDATYDLARKGMIAGINLTDPYLRRKTSVKYATSEKPQASITAIGETTTLSQYGVSQLVRPVNWSNERIQSMGVKFGQWPGWTKRRGAPGIGIPVNQKAVGRSAEVTRGTTSLFAHGFAIPGKTDGDGHQLIFSRNPETGKLRVLLGPAVYQLFGYQIKLLEPQISDDLEATLYAKIDAAIAAVFE